MRIPKEFTIRGNLWHVEYKWRLVDDGMEPCDGLTDPTTKTIYLQHGLGEEKERVFIHEFIHAVLFEHSFYVTSLTRDVEDLICNIIAEMLLDKFKIKWRRIL